MMGWFGRILKVDLTAATAVVETLPQDWLHSYIGGRGLAVRLLRDHCCLEPCSVDIPLVFAVGPLTGTQSPTAERMCVASRSPLTGTLFDSSCGGSFPRDLKASGFDAISVSGCSASPVIIRIENDSVRIEPAGRLWGQTTDTTAALLMGSGSVACIGPAGENGVLYANIVTADGSAAGRGGLGAVMGSKNLKAIVVRGNRRVVVARPQRFEQGVSDVMRLFKASPVIFGELGFSEYGTPALVDVSAQRRMVPTRNFSATWFGGAANYSAPALRRSQGAQKKGCGDCPVRCKKVSATGEKIPEYNSLSHFGALNNISDPKIILAATTLCDRLGMDTVSAAATIAAWCESRGAYPAAEELCGLLEAIAYRRGVGDRLALGSRRLLIESSNSALSMTVKGLELPAFDPRGAYGLALAYAVSTRGGCHLRAYPISHEILRKPVATDRFDFSGKARMTKLAEDTNAIVDSLVACRFALLAASLEEYAELLCAVTGSDFNVAELMACGERICLTERYCNQQNGFTAADDVLPQRFFSEEGSSEGAVVIRALNREHFDAELQRYYRLRGLDENGLLSDAFNEDQP